MPRVSVIIPAYHHAAFIGEAIDSVLAQTYRDFEIVVVNDGSPDETEEVLRPYIESGKIRYLWQENQGAAAARNRGVEVAEGELLAFLDDDDQWLPDKLEWQVACLEESDALMVVGTSLLQGASNKPSWRSRPQAYDVLSLENFFKGNPVGSPGQALIRKADLVRAGGFDVAIWGADDLDLWIRLSQLGEIRRYPRPCLLYRQHASNASMDFRRMGMNTLKVLSRHLDSSGQSRGRHRIYAYRFLFRYTGRKLLWEAARHWREGRRKEAKDALKEVHRVFRVAILRDPKLAFSFAHAAIKTPWKLHKHRNSDYRRHRRITLPCVAPCDDTQYGHFESSFLPLAPSPRLLECLLEGGRLVYLPNPGNLGDGMIATATTLLFEKLGVCYEVFDENASYGDDWTLIYGGGGACVPYWNILDKLKAIFTMTGIERCIILPHSIRECPVLLAVMDSRFTVFCRETASFEYCRSMNQQAEFVLADDMALTLDLKDFPPLSDAQRKAISPLKFLGAYLGLLSRNQRNRIKVLAKLDHKTRRRLLKRLGKHVLPFGRDLKIAWFMRRDQEKTDVIGDSLPNAPFMDLSRYGGGDCRDELVNYLGVELFLHAINEVDVVVTDRLHVGVGAALLGKHLVWLDNSYGKVHGVYQNSMAHIPHIHFVHSKMELDAVLKDLASSASPTCRHPRFQTSVMVN
jgi:glycosyltransferase involved in cell wall biosynthesis/exopolysaccharide biosynthesis predicted pyruvyltransferase EpsI